MVCPHFHGYSPVSMVDAYNTWSNSSKLQHVPQALQPGLILASSASSLL